MMEMKGTGQPLPNTFDQTPLAKYKPPNYASIYVEPVALRIVIYKTIKEMVTIGPLFYSPQYGYMTVNSEGNIVKYEVPNDEKQAISSVLYVTGSLDDYEFDTLIQISERGNVAVYDSIRDVEPAPIMDRLARRFMQIDQSDAVFCVIGGNTDHVVAMADCAYAYAKGIPVYTYIGGIDIDVSQFVCISDKSGFEFISLVKEIVQFLS